MSSMASLSGGMAGASAAIKVTAHERYLERIGQQIQIVKSSNLRIFELLARAYGPRPEKAEATGDKPRTGGSLDAIDGLMIHLDGLLEEQRKAISLLEEIV